MKRKNKKILAMDYGSKHIGVAVGYDQFLTAFPKGVISHTSQQDVLNKIREMTRAEHITQIVIGLPKTLGGKQSHQAQETIAFAKELRKYIPLPIAFIDERLTTRIAKNKMATFSFSPSKRKHLKDELSALAILETYFALHNHEDK